MKCTITCYNCNETFDIAMSDHEVIGSDFSCIYCDAEMFIKIVPAPMAPTYNHLWHSIIDQDTRKMIAIEGRFHANRNSEQHTSFWENGKWIEANDPVDYVDRVQGIEFFRTEIPKGTPWAHFYESGKYKTGRGNQTVTIHYGDGEVVEFTSYAQADTWASQYIPQ